MSAMSVTLRAIAIVLLGGASLSLAAPPDSPPQDKQSGSRAGPADDGAAAHPQRKEGKSEQERKNLPAADSPNPAQGRDRGEQGGTDARGSQGPTGATTGSTGQGGAPGSGASSGSGGTADQR